MHWQEWSEDALAWARERDVPILLSVGYAACHWCHVMAHESFEDDDTALVMNDNFVCIKVDREERPDIDALYMNATVAMTGQGGWPMTCFLTPAAEPFYCGTYYPKTARGGMPSFTQVLLAIAQTWRDRREDVQEAATGAVDALRQNADALPAGEFEVNAELLDHAVAAVLRDEDRTHGGFGGAPKFPPSALLEGLIRNFERTGAPQVWEAVHRTAEAMARGGIYDQLAGGFARYAVDTTWTVPHFEKMLYDNAQLLRVYGHLARRSGSLLAHRVAEETAEFLLTDLITEAGGFASALDADTVVDPAAEGVEGATYVWTPGELAGELGPADGNWAAELFAVTTAGTFEHGTSVLQLPVDPTDAPRMARVRAAMREVRNRRPQPARDDKVIAAWNGMAVNALAEAGASLGHAEWVQAAARCARHLLDVHVTDGRVRRASLGGTVGTADGVLEDYAWLATGLLALHQATGESDWLAQAQEILDAAISHFADPDEPGGWFDTADDAEVLVLRPRDPIDGATPAGASSLAEALLTASCLADPDAAARYGELADATLRRASVVLARAPRSAGQWLAVAEAAIRGPLQVAVSLGEDGDTGLLAEARSYAPGGAVIVGGRADSTPLLVDRPLVEDAAAAYVCRGFVCDRPVLTVEDLREALAR